jgi:hypothetical protein
MDIDLKFEEIIILLTEIDDVDFIKLILTKYPKYLAQILKFSLRNESKNIIKYLLEEQNFDPSMNNNKLIKLATELGWIEIINIIVKDERVDVSVEQNEPLYLAISNYHYEIAKEILKYLKKPLNIKDIDYDIPEDILKLVKDHVENGEEESQQKKIKI